jgi:hypothetical protein
VSLLQCGTTICCCIYSELLVFAHLRHRHRINTSEFKPLDFLANKFVIQVACGQQHSICRAVERSHVQEALAQGGAEVGVGSDCGADAYVWGNGTLGQLGLGTLRRCLHVCCLLYVDGGVTRLETGGGCNVGAPSLYLPVLYCTRMLFNSAYNVN